MRVHLACVSALVFIVFIVSAAASEQTRPNFSGTWVLVAQPDAPEQSIKQDAKTLTLSHASEGDDHVEVYNLDGTETTNKMEAHGGFIVSTYKASWNKSQLNLTRSSVYPDGRTLLTSQVWSLDNTGELVIDMTNTITGEAPVKERLVHRKRPTRRQQ